MATQRLLINDAGALKELVPNQVSAGAADAGKVPALNSAGKIDETMIPAAFGPDAQTLVASEDIGAGKLVNIHDVGGNFRVRLADASNNRPANGFAKNAIANTAAGTIYFDSTNDAVSGLTPGDLYLSPSSPGGVQSAAPTAAGHIVQKVGFAHSATAFNFQYTQPVLLA